MIERSFIFGALESPSHLRSDLEEIPRQLAEFEWLKTLAEACRFCRVDLSATLPKDDSFTA
jgi:hypothetical protein